MDSSTTKPKLRQFNAPYSASRALILAPARQMAKWQKVRRAFTALLKGNGHAGMLKWGKMKTGDRRLVRNDIGMGGAGGPGRNGAGAGGGPATGRRLSFGGWEMR